VGRVRPAGGNAAEVEAVASRAIRSCPPEAAVEEFAADGIAPVLTGCFQGFRYCPESATNTGHNTLHALIFVAMLYGFLN
jgi:hypothetical protein